VIVLPILLPFFFGICSVLAWKSQQIQKILSLIGTLLIGVSAIWIFLDIQLVGIQSIQIGNWIPPFGISVVVDFFSAIMVVIASFVAISVAWYSQVGIDEKRARFGFYPLFFFLLMGVNGAFITGDLFNLYVWFEVMLMSSFVLIALGSERPQIEGAVKYLVLNMLSSTLFLIATGLTYNLTGTLNLADLAANLPKVFMQSQITLIAILFLIAFSIKSAAFPLFFWLPASYHTPPVTVTALFSGLLTKVGVYALIRVFTLLFIFDTSYTHTILLIMAAFTMVVGVLGAAAQMDFRRLLSFHIISQIGYLIWGLGMYSQQALAATIYFFLHVILAKTALFYVAGIVNHIQASFDLKKLGNLYSTRIGIALLFLIPALSLAGLPPLPGFFAKLGLIIAGFQLKQYGIVAIGLAVSFMTLYSMTKVWNEAFWKNKQNMDNPGDNQPVPIWMIAPTVLLIVITLLMTTFTESIMLIANQAAAQLMNPNIYIQAVFGGQP
jgi:multicomponent Na+:H+ antiporter subunit D